MRSLAALCCAGALALAPVAAPAQEAEESLLDTLARAATLDAEAQRSGLVSFVENQISSPDRQIRLTNIEGALSSEASIGQITISDTEGIWLIIENAAINWNQGALLFGRLEVRSLSADSITYVRNPVSTEEPGMPSPEAGGFSVPEFPVAIVLESLSVPRVRFGEEVFGLGSEISVSGSMTLEGGAIDAEFDIERLDGPGGTLALDLAYANETREIDLDLQLIEPENGILANLLNIEGRPEIALGLSGAGPIEDLSVALTFDAGNQRILTGAGTLNESTRGLAIDAALEGPVADILPAAYGDFFGAQTTLALNALLPDAGGLDLMQLNLSGGQLSLNATGATTADWFLRRLDIKGEIGIADDGPVTLPVPGATTKIDRGRFSVDFGAEDSEYWLGTLEVQGLETPDFGAERFALTANGIAANLDDPATRRITFNGDGTAEGIAARSPEIADALGARIGFGVAGLWEAGDPVQLAQLRLVGQALLLEMAGEIDGGVFEGDIALDADTLAPFSGLAGRDLSGAIALDAAGTLSPAIGGFDLTLDGTARDLSVGEPVADSLIGGEAQLSGRIARTEAGIVAENFALTTSEVSLTADGTFSSNAADFGFDIVLADLAALSPDATGELTVSGTAAGEEGVLDLVLTATVPQGELADRALRDARIGFTGINRETGLVGEVEGTAFLEGHRISLHSGIDANAERLVLSDIAFSAPGTDLSGNLNRLASGLLEGRIALNAPNIETAAALALVEARGAATANIRLTRGDGTQSAFVSANLDNIVFGDIALRSGRIEGAVVNLFDVPTIDGTVEASGASAGGLDIETLQLTANATGRNTQFSGSARLANQTDATLSGSLAPITDGYRIALENFSLAQGELSARLSAPATLTVANDTVQFSGVDLAIGSGRISATGSAGETLDIALEVTALPLNIANTVVPGLGLAGTLDGTARISGTPSDPRATFAIEGGGLGAAAINELGIAPLSVSSEGSFADNRVTLTNARATGSQGLSATAQGVIPLAGNGLDIAIDGSIPLSLANRFIADSGAQVIGTASLDARVTGRIDDPRFSGSVSVAGAEYIDPALALRLQDINASATLSASAVTINSASARLVTGGVVSASGTIGLDANLTSNVAITLDNARYADGNLLVATLNGGLNFTGPLTAGGLLSGNIAIQRADITIPEGFGPDSTLVAVEHRNAPGEVAATLARARADERAQGNAAAPAPIRLDVAISAPNQIFLRGRGLDAEVGGSLRITGNLAAIEPVGGFELIRGRLAILGQRIDFESGTVTLIGDLDPFIDLVARTEGEGITVFVTVTGRASAPQISFSSQPMLPEDEVLAQLLFNRSVGDLSPLQLAQLAAAAAEFAGGGGNNSLLDSLRQATGLDDLDIVTDAEGNAGVRAGRYLSDELYLGVEAGAGGQSRVTIDLEITDSLRARGATGTDGDSSVGIFYEQDY
ncbi:translocation/assembly module TamB domain-containing protein [Pelagibacterium sediminicola]|uniref:translocation/assembly module TamB domain-containing protein n=1 Tax=Pelagibacterium sediminicola TaxID=2248761 RepID=UPI000E3249E8|nr:translocation/assembly module TamB domain-containing protein [Pelagibacterium sediminicola]